MNRDSSKGEFKLYQLYRMSTSNQEWPWEVDRKVSPLSFSDCHSGWAPKGWLSPPIRRFAWHTLSSQVAAPIFPRTPRADRRTNRRPDGGAHFAVCR